MKNTLRALLLTLTLALGGLMGTKAEASPVVVPPLPPTNGGGSTPPTCVYVYFVGCIPVFYTAPCSN